jgi:hypothetical protein
MAVVVVIEKEAFLDAKDTKYRLADRTIIVEGWRVPEVYDRTTGSK